MCSYDVFEHLHIHHFYFSFHALIQIQIHPLKPMPKVVSNPNTSKHSWSFPIEIFTRFISFHSTSIRYINLILHTFHISSPSSPLYTHLFQPSKLKNLDNATFSKGKSSILPSYHAIDLFSLHQPIHICLPFKQPSSTIERVCVTPMCVVKKKKGKVVDVTLFLQSIQPTQSTYPRQTHPFHSFDPSPTRPEFPSISLSKRPISHHPIPTICTPHQN